jgi:hypothetical protein
VGLTGMKVKKVLKGIVSGVFVYTFCALYTFAANISLIPATTTIDLNKKDFIVEVLVTDNQTSINAVEVFIQYPAEYLEITSIIKDRSIINYWVDEPTYSNINGVLSFAGVTFNGFTRNKVSVLTIRFKAKKSGVAPLVVSNGRLLANDGLATDVTGNFIGSVFSIVQHGESELTIK